MILRKVRILALDLIYFFLLVSWSSVVHSQERNSGRRYDLERNKAIFETEVNRVANSSDFEYKIQDLAADNEIEKWEAPLEYQQNYPYYLSGFDEEDRPIWITEWGKYNLRKIVEGGPEAMAIFDNFTRQSAHRVVKSRTLRNPQGTRVLYLIDMEGLQFDQVAHIPTVGYTLQLAREYRKVLEEYVHLAFIVNANYVTETIINIVKPVLGRVLENVEVFGTNRARWLPQVLKHFPKDQIPEWYGGEPGFKPYRVYG